MRIAVLIIGLLLGLLMFIQTVLIGILGGVAEDEAMSTAGAVGFLVAIAWLVACALVIAFPLVSTILFVLAGLMAFGVSGDYPDMGVWGVVSLILAVMSFFGWIGKRKKERRERLREAKMDDLLAGRAAARPQVRCPQCGTDNPMNARFCSSCGLARNRAATP